MKKVILSLWALLFLFGGCTCDCFDEGEKAINFQFTMLPEVNGFSQNDINEVILYKLQKGTQTKLDSIKTPELFRYSCCDVISLDEYGLFAGNDFWNYDYSIKTKSNHTFAVTDIVVEGKLSGSIICKCYSNTRKTFKVNGVHYDLTNKGKAWFENLVKLTK